ncbi:hypothetical protein AAG906_010219 [Vitis piasezkii]
MEVQLASGSVASQWQLVRTLGDQVKQPIDLQLAGEMMVCASGWHVQPLCRWWVVMQGVMGEGRLAKEGSLAPRTHEKFSVIFKGVTPTIEVNLTQQIIVVLKIFT